MGTIALWSQPEHTVISFDTYEWLHVKIHWGNWVKKLTYMIKKQLCTQKRTNFQVLNRQVCFKDIINMHAASRIMSFLFQNLISLSLISGNSWNESFYGINWMRDFSSLISRQNVFERDYIRKNLCCRRECWYFVPKAQNEQICNSILQFLSN